MTHLFDRRTSCSEDENCFEDDNVNNTSTTFGDSGFFTPALSLDNLFCQKPTRCSQAALDVSETTFDWSDDSSSDENIDLLRSSHGPKSESLKKINVLWNENYPAVGFRRWSSSTNKVNFAPNPHFVTIHIVDTEERKGNWHHVIRERENFERRILQLEQVLNPVLGDKHRTKVTEQRKR